MPAVIATAFFAFPGGVMAVRVPDDTYFSNQWYLDQVGAPEAWEKSLGFEGVIVALIDTGVDLDHPDLRDNIWRNADEIPGNLIDDDGNGYVDDVQGWDFVDNDPNPRVDLRSGDNWNSGVSHGTVSAGIIAARGDNGQGISGITWQTTIMPIRALNRYGQGDPIAVVKAVEYAVRNGAQVINLALAGSVEDESLRVALRRAYDAGAFVVAAAGNAPDGAAAVDLDASPRYPVCLDFGSDENFIYGVAATDEDDHRADFSNYGAGCIDLSAPGSRVISTVPFRRGTENFGEAYRGYFNGTSTAASLVSGAVALVKAMDPHLTPKQIANLLTETSVRVDDKNPGFYGRLGRGRLNVAAAVAKLAAERRQVELPVATASLVPDGNISGLVLAASGEGRPTEIRMFTGDGAMIRSWRPFSDGFEGGAEVSTANFDGKGRRTIVAAAGQGGIPQIRIFDVNSGLIGGFLAYDSFFRGGIAVAAGDLDGDGLDEIVAVPKGGGGPHVRIFSNRGIVMGGFFAFDESERGGWQLSVKDVNGDGRAEIIVMTNDGGRLRVFSGWGDLLAELRQTGDGNPPAQLLVSDGDADGRQEIGVISTVDGQENLRFFGLDGKIKLNLNLWEGVLSGEGHYAFGTPVGGPPTVRLPDSFGRLGSFQVFESAFRGGTSAAVIE